MSRNDLDYQLFIVENLSRTQLDFLVNDIRLKSKSFFEEYGNEDAYDQMFTDPRNRKFFNRLRNGGEIKKEEIQEIVIKFLNQYHCHFPHKYSYDLLEALEKVRKSLDDLPSSLENLTEDRLPLIIDIFCTLDKVPHIGGTTASKILSLLRSELFMMLDDPIAKHYGFALNSKGYRHFLFLMRDLSIKLIDYQGSKQKFELYIRHPERRWKAPLAKLLDEWNWMSMNWVRSLHEG